MIYDYLPRIRQQQEQRDMAERAGSAMWATLAAFLLAYIVLIIL